jgi:hypothetical protein
MANVKITDLTIGSAVATSDPFESVQSGTSVQVTADQIKTYTNTGPSLIVTNDLPFFGTYPILSSMTDGTDSSCSNGDIYWASVFIPHSATLTGIQYLNGSVVGTNRVIVALYDNAGALVANSALSGALTVGANTMQKVAFTSTEAATGPNYYYIAVQFNGTTDKFRTIPANTICNAITIANSDPGTFGTLPTIIPGSTFVANQGPIAYTY